MRTSPNVNFITAMYFPFSNTLISCEVVQLFKHFLITARSTLLFIRQIIQFITQRVGTVLGVLQVRPCLRYEATDTGYGVTGIKDAVFVIFLRLRANEFSLFPFAELREHQSKVKFASQIFFPMSPVFECSFSCTVLHNLLDKGNCLS